MAFNVNLECEPCYAARYRVGQCGKCGGPLRGGHRSHAPRCSRCSPPPSGRVPVIVLNDIDDRERLIWRTQAPGGGMRVAGRYLPAGSDPYVVTLPLKQWLSLRS